MLISTSMVVGAILTYFIPIVGLSILLFSLVAWNFFGGQWYDEGKFKRVFLSFTVFYLC